MTKHSFDLEERTLEFSKKVIRFCKQLPQNVINRKLIAQLVDASGSVGANYREANSEYQEEIRKLLTEAIELKKIFSSIADKFS
jgi:hypothetical protein